MCEISPEVHSQSLRYKKKIVISICFLPSFIHVKSRCSGAKSIIKSKFVFAIEKLRRNLTWAATPLLAGKLGLEAHFWITLLEELPSPTRSLCSSLGRPLVALAVLGDKRRPGGGQARLQRGAPRRCSGPAERHRRWSRRALWWTALRSPAPRPGCSAGRRRQRPGRTGRPRPPAAPGDAEQRHGFARVRERGSSRPGRNMALYAYTPISASGWSFLLTLPAFQCLKNAQCLPKGKKNTRVKVDRDTQVLDKRTLLSALETLAIASAQQ